MSDKEGGALLAIVVIVLTISISAMLIFLSRHLHAKIALTVLLYLAYTTLTIRSVGDRTYRIFERLQEKNLLFARQELFPIMGGGIDHLTEPEVIRATVLAIARNSVQGVVAPLFYLALGGIPLAMAYRAIYTLCFALGQKDSFYQGWGFASARLYEWANYLPERITGFLMAMGAAFLFGTGHKTCMILIRNVWKKNILNVGIPEVVSSGAIGISPFHPSIDSASRPIWTFSEDEINEPKSHHITDAIKLMSAVACTMLILCMMMF